MHALSADVTDYLVDEIDAVCGVSGRRSLLEHNHIVETPTALPGRSRPQFAPTNVHTPIQREQRRRRVKDRHPARHPGTIGGTVTAPGCLVTRARQCCHSPLSRRCAVQVNLPCCSVRTIPVRASNAPAKVRGELARLLKRHKVPSISSAR